MILQRHLIQPPTRSTPTLTVPYPKTHAGTFSGYSGEYSGKREPPRFPGTIQCAVRVRVRRQAPVLG